MIVFVKKSEHFYFLRIEKPAMSALVALCFQVSATPWRLMESLTTDWEDAKITTCPRRGVRRYHGRSDSMSCSRFLDLILVKTDLGSADAPTFSNYTIRVLYPQLFGETDADEPSFSDKLFFCCSATPSATVMMISCVLRASMCM